MDYELILPKNDNAFLVRTLNTIGIIQLLEIAMGVITLQIVKRTSCFKLFTGTAYLISIRLHGFYERILWNSKAITFILNDIGTWFCDWILMLSTLNTIIEQKAYSQRVVAISFWPNAEKYFISRFEHFETIKSHNTSWSFYNE